MSTPNATAPGIQVVQPTDHIDIGNAFELKGRLQELIRMGQTRVIIDLAHVQYIDSAGLSSLMAVVHAFQAVGGAVRLCNPQPNVLKIFHLTKLDEYLPLSLTLDEARAALAPTA